MNILIRCDGSEENGLNHILKYLAFADKLKAIYNCPITFAMRNSESWIKTVKRKYPVLSPHIEREDLNEEEWIYNIVRFARPDILILSNNHILKSDTVEKIKKIKKIKVLVSDIIEYEEKVKFMDLSGYHRNK